MTHRSSPEGLSGHSPQTDDQVLGVLWGPAGARRGVSKDKPPQRAWVCRHMCHLPSPRQHLTGHQHPANFWIVGLRGLEGSFGGQEHVSHTI